MINNIQGLRAFAAINVVFFHILVTASTYGQEVKFFNVFKGWGANGVDIFFVISGFVMLHTQIKKKKSAGTFLLARVLRIVPMYWLLTSFVVALYFFLPTIFNNLEITPLWALSSYLFVSDIFWGRDPVVNIGWTLEWEMLFYFIFSATLFLKNWLSVLLSVGLVLGYIAVSFENLIVIEFFLGMVIAYFYEKNKLSAKVGTWVLLVGAILLSISLDRDIIEYQIDRAFLWGVPAAFIVFGSLYSKQVNNQVLTYLGDASYSIYLVQILTIPAFYKFSSLQLSFLNSDVLAVLCLIISVVSGCLLYSTVEKPIVLTSKRLLSLAPSRASFSPVKSVR